MIFLKLLRGVFSKQSSKFALAFLLILYSGSLNIAYWMDGWNFWTTTYWFVVTVTTVGYGDLSPGTITSQAWTMCVILGGCGSLLTVLEAIIEFFIIWETKKMKGLQSYNDLIGHTILMINGNKDTIDELVNHVFSDVNRKPIKILLVSNSIDEYNDTRVLFVKGELASDDVIERSSLKDANKILIWGSNDNEVTLTSVAVSTVNPKANIVVRLDHDTNAKHIKRINPNASIIGTVNKALAIQELQDQGIGDMIVDLLDNNGEATPYAIHNPNELELDDLLYKIKIVDKESKLLAVKYKGGEVTFFPSHTYGIETVYIIAKQRPMI